MILTFNPKSRLQMIAVGHYLGDYFYASSRHRPWAIRLSGDRDSGKSLIALAIDRSFRPKEYPKGILKSRHSADNLMLGPVVFCNMRDNFYTDKNEFDEGLKKFMGQSPESRVHIVSNLNRFFMPHFNAVADSTNSDILDLDIEVKKGSRSNRHLTLTTDHVEIYDYLKDNPLCLR